MFLPLFVRALKKNVPLSNGPRGAPKLWPASRPRAENREAEMIGTRARAAVLVGLHLAAVQSLPLGGVPGAPPPLPLENAFARDARVPGLDLPSIRGGMKPIEFDCPAQFRADVTELMASRPVEKTQLYYISTVGSTYTKLWDVEAWDAHISIWRYGSLPWFRV
jgi:hypothetical protein